MGEYRLPPAEQRRIEQETAGSVQYTAHAAEGPADDRGGGREQKGWKSGVWSLGNLLGSFWSPRKSEITCAAVSQSGDAAMEEGRPKPPEKPVKDEAITTSALEGRSLVGMDGIDSPSLKDGSANEGNIDLEMQGTDPVGQQPSSIEILHSR